MHNSIVKDTSDILLFLLALRRQLFNDIVGVFPRQCNELRMASSGEELVFIVLELDGCKCHRLANCEDLVAKSLCGCVSL